MNDKEITTEIMLLIFAFDMRKNYRKKILKKTYYNMDVQSHTYDEFMDEYHTNWDNMSYEDKEEFLRVIIKFDKPSMTSDFYTLIQMRRLTGSNKMALQLFKEYKKNETDKRG